MQHFRQKIADLARWIIRQFTEHSVAQSLVKPRRLEAERVYPRSLAARRHGQSLRLFDQPPAPTCSAQFICHGQNVDAQPTPVQASDQPAHDAAAIVTQGEGKWLRLPNEATGAAELVQG